MIYKFSIINNPLPDINIPKRINRYYINKGFFYRSISKKYKRNYYDI